MIGDCKYSGYREIVNVNISVHQSCVQELGTYRPVWGDQFLVRAELRGPHWNVTIEKPGDKPLSESDITTVVRTMCDSLREWLPQANLPENLK